MEVKDDVQIVSTAAKNLMESKEYAAQKFVSESLSSMRQKMLTAIAQVNKWKRAIISLHDAQEQAKLEYMTKSEQQVWQNFFELLGQKKHLEEFLKNLHKSKETDKEEMKAYNDLLAGVKAKISALETSLAPMRKPIEDIRRRLELPDCRNNILLVTHQILQANNHARKMLRQANHELEQAVDELKNALFTKTLEEPQTTFKTREVYNLIRHQYSALKEERQDLFVQKVHLQRQIISPQRALAMAKNIFVHGDYKRLRKEIRRYKKAEQRLTQKSLAYSKEEKEFQTRDWSLFSHSLFLQQQYYLTKQRTLLEIEKAHLDLIKLSLQKKQTELETLCRLPAAAKKIEEITIGILRKNLRFVRQLEKIESRDQQLSERMAHARKQLDALKVRLDRDKPNTQYKIISPNLSTSNDSAASIIADAILFDPQVVQLVARFDGNALEMEKDWEMMSEFDKDEFIRKKIIREL